MSKNGLHPDGQGGTDDEVIEEDRSSVDVSVPSPGTQAMGIGAPTEQTIQSTMDHSWAQLSQSQGMVTAVPSQAGPLPSFEKYGEHADIKPYQHYDPMSSYYPPANSAYMPPYYPGASM